MYSVKGFTEFQLQVLFLSNKLRLPIVLGTVVLVDKRLLLEQDEKYV